MEQTELDETVERARVALANANWDESKHPRRPDGRFGGGHTCPKERQVIPWNGETADEV